MYLEGSVCKAGVATADIILGVFGRLKLLHHDKVPVHGEDEMYGGTLSQSNPEL
jgi:hypothetical protein